jgi:hypothetical protein
MKKSANADATQKDPRRNNERIIRSPRGTVLSAKSWLTEAPLRMLMNNLDPEDVRAATTALIRDGGFCEYFDPLTGEGIGGATFSWTAAIALLLEAAGRT